MTSRDSDSRDLGLRAKQFTLGNLAMILGVCFWGGVVYQKVDAIQSNNAMQWKEIQHQRQWMQRLSLKTGVDEPSYTQ